MRFLFLILAIFPFICKGQFTDDFSDGNFTENPVWIGDIERFIVNNNKELQLFDELQTSPSYLVTESGAVNGASWEFIVRFAFNPSSTSFADVYLISDNQNLNSSLNGYFIRIGDTSDDVSLYRKDGNAAVKIIDGTDKRLDVTNVRVRVRATRDLSGNWNLYSDTTGGRDYYHEGSVFDSTYTNSSYFGVHCTYIASRWNLIYFNEFIVTDNSVQPEIISYDIIDDKNIALNFNKELDQTSALNTSNYFINNQIGSPITVSFDNQINTRVLLQFSNSFSSGNYYTLYFQDIADAYGNSIISNSINFLFFIIEPGVVVINEIMRKSEPVVGLPNGNYVELFNTTDFEIDISNWIYKISIYSKTLPNYIMSPGEYVILCDTTHAAMYMEYGNVIPIPGFPAMNNTGQTIILFDNNSNIIDQVIYSETWYTETWKRDGGWSLEKIDPLNFCGTFDNWKASVNPLGGTPGFINSVNAPNIDTVAPEVLFVQVTAANEITVYFSERVIAENALDLNNYYVSPEYGNPIYALQSSDLKTVILQFLYAFTPNTDYTLLVENISDFCNNIMGSQQISFLVYNPKAFDILITEIMPKPDPVVVLPNAEYVELFNTTDFDIDLSNWKFSAGTSTRVLPFGVIKAKSYIILCHENNKHLFSDYGDVLGVASFPALTNSGTSLTLQFTNDEVIHTVTYSDTWFKENFKKQGGWSLEMIDTDNPCEEANNWRESKDSRGGTPGSQNSISGTNPDVISPYPVAAEAIAPDTVIVWFNEILLKDFAENSQNFSIDGFGHPIWIKAHPPRYSQISMKFNAEFELGQVYYLDIIDSIRDCSENLVAAYSSIRLGLADSIAAGDLVINEILFNPYTGGSNFVEVYNKSDKVLDLKKLWISNRNSAGDIANSRQISDRSRLVLPGEFCAINTNNENIKNTYFVPNEEALFQATSLPSMANASGFVIITDRFFNMIDEISYTEKQHYKLLANVKGVSLERLNYNRPSSDRGNWHSAAESVGFATPGYENSQYQEEIDIVSKIEVFPEVFSPDNDGYDDLLNIAYEFDQPGYTATIAIYNSSGILIKFLAQNELLGTSGHFYWDGFDNKDNPCPIGIYVLYAELFSLSGKQIVEKHAFVLSRKKY